MPILRLETIINAEIEICFDLSRSIDLHKISTAQTNEKAIAGRVTGLINLNEFVTWEATHFGITQKLSSQITAYQRPQHFRDEQIKGAFKYIIHDHYFESQNGKTIMTDIFDFEAPFGFIGKIVSKSILSKHLQQLLEKRNITIKEFAESDKWKSVIPN